jgi:hypothetical protein
VKEKSPKLATVSSLSQASGPQHSTIVEFVIGDVHGCYEELLDLEKLINSTCQALEVPQEQILFVIVGDLIDRGDQVLEVIKHVKKGVDSGSHLSLCGNHEAIFLEFAQFFGRGEIQNILRNCTQIVPLTDQFLTQNAKEAGSVIDLALDRLRMWLAQGGRTTLDALQLGLDPMEWNLDTPECLEICRFIASLPLCYASKSVYVSHALASPRDFEFIENMKLATEDTQLSVADRLQHLNGLLWARDWTDRWPKEMPPHVSGHTPLEECAWVDGGKRLMIDTGCVYGGTLSAWSPQLNTTLSVPSKRNLRSLRKL